MSVGLPRAEARLRTDAPATTGRAPIGRRRVLTFGFLLAVVQLLWIALLAYGIWFILT